MNKIILIILIIVIFLMGGIFLLSRMFNYSPTMIYNNPPSNNQTTDTPSADTNVQPNNQTSAVTISNFIFDPSPLTIALGTTVTWTNGDTVPHQIKSNTFNSDIIPSGSSFSYKFDKKGTYNYSCAIHPFMMGQITVQ